MKGIRECIVYRSFGYVFKVVVIVNKFKLKFKFDVQQQMTSTMIAVDMQVYSFIENKIYRHLYGLHINAVDKQLRYQLQSLNVETHVHTDTDTCT